MLDFSIEFICGIFNINTNPIKKEIYNMIYKGLNIIPNEEDS